MKVKHMNNIYNNPFETEQQRRQRLERERWQNGSRQPQSFTSSNTTAAPAWQNNVQPTTTTPTQPDYSKMSLREELSDRMDRAGFRQKEWTLSTPLGNFTYLDDSDADTPEENPNRQPEQFTGSATASQSEPLAFAKQTTNDNETPRQGLTNFLKNQEGLSLHPYNDTEKKTTVCYGHMDETSSNFSQHPFYNNQTAESAGTIDKLNAFKHLQGLPKQNRKAPDYAGETNLRLTPEYCNQLLDKDINIRHNELNNKFPNFGNMSPDMQNALLETHYNANILKKQMDPKKANYNQHIWKNLIQAAKEMDQPALCQNLHRDESERPDLKERNEWALEQCLKGFFYK